MIDHSMSKTMPKQLPTLKSHPIHCHPTNVIDFPFPPCGTWSLTQQKYDNTLHENTLILIQKFSHFACRSVASLSHTYKARHIIYRFQKKTPHFRANVERNQPNKKYKYLSSKNKLGNHYEPARHYHQRMFTAKQNVIVQRHQRFVIFVYKQNAMSDRSKQTRLVQYDWLESQEGREFLGVLLRRNKRRIFGL